MRLIHVSLLNGTNESHVEWTKKNSRLLLYIFKESIINRIHFLILDFHPFMQYTHLRAHIHIHIWMGCTIGEECFCRDWHGCIMAQSIVGLENVQPYKFSECSKKDYIDALRIGHGLCLLNKPNEVRYKTL